MTAWRDVEVAAAEALEDGPTPDDLEAIRGATFTVEAVKEREAVTDHDVAAFVDVLSASAGPGGRWIHYGLTSSDVLDTALALQIRRAGVPIVAGARELGARRSPSGRASSPTRCASAARTACTPSRPRSASSSPATRSRPTATPSGWSAPSSRPRSARSPARSAPTRAHEPGYEARVLERLELRARGHLDPGRPARPPRRAAAGDRAGRRRARALRDRDPPPPAHRGARGRGAVPRRPEGLERDAAQAQPDHHRAHHRPRARAARLRAGGARERRAVARARHLALRRRARDPARRDDPARLHAAPRAAGRARDDRPRRPDGAQPRHHLRRAVLPDRAARARRGRDDARRGVPDRAGERPAGVGHADAAARRCSAEQDLGLDLDAIFDYARFTRHVPELLARLDEILVPA